MNKLTKAQRRRNMQANKSSGTKPERLLGSELHARNIRYRKNRKDIFGKPDFSIKKIKLAVFVDGEFWHGKNWQKRKYDHKTNIKFWHSKIERNIERDKEVNTKLKEEGWTIMRFWAKDIEKNLVSCADKIEEKIKELNNEN